MLNYCVLQLHGKFALGFRLWSGAVLKENIWGGALWCILKATVRNAPFCTYMVKYLGQGRGLGARSLCIDDHGLCLVTAAGASC